MTVTNKLLSFTTKIMVQHFEQLTTLYLKLALQKQILLHINIIVSIRLVLFLVALKYHFVKCSNIVFVNSFVFLYVVLVPYCKEYKYHFITSLLIVCNKNRNYTNFLRQIMLSQHCILSLSSTWKGYFIAIFCS